MSEASVPWPAQTVSEQYLTKLADRSFLRLWTFPSPYRRVTINLKPGSKEVCDLLVVCGEYILIFSDKSIQWPNGDVGNAWVKWHRKTIRNSVKQIDGAARFLAGPEVEIFTDPKLQNSIPVELPPIAIRKVHGIVVANGAAAACKEHFNRRRGSLHLTPSASRDSHGLELPHVDHPFCIGDANPGGAFVHILDEHNLDIVLTELDTMLNFVRYLDAKERFIRSGDLHFAKGEESLVAWYINAGRRFRLSDFGESTVAPNTVGLDETVYDSFTEAPQYEARRAANLPSYEWDRLIDDFSKMARQESGSPAVGSTGAQSEVERALRALALEQRLDRRVHSAAIKLTLKEASERGCMVRIFRVPVSFDTSAAVIFVMAWAEMYPESISEQGERHIFRQEMLQAWAYSILEQKRQCKRIVGIGLLTDARGFCPPDATRYVRHLEVSTWTADVLADVDRARSRFKIEAISRRPTMLFRAHDFPQNE